MKKYYPLLCILLSYLPASAQKEYMNWYFGGGAGLSFISGNANVLVNGFNRLDVNCATWSDPATGQLLMYADNGTIYDREHRVMDNGGERNDMFFGGTVIVPHPGKPDQYFVFGSDGSMFLTFDIVDMKKNGGRGSVISRHNIVAPIRSEKQFEVVKHPFADAYWLVSHDQAGTYNAFYIDQNGIGTQVESTVGLVLDPMVDGLGELCASNKGDKLVATHYGVEDHLVELFDFDPVCGKVSNARKLPREGDWDMPYGAAFSPDDSKLYITYSVGESQLVQYSGPDFQSMELIAASPTNFNHIRIAPDNKLYIATFEGEPEGNLMDVIHKPDLPGSSCLYRRHAINLGTQKYADFELPTAIAGKSVSRKPIVDSIILVEGLCSGSGTQLSFKTTFTYDSLKWVLTDTPSSAIYSDPVISHTYAREGTYPVDLHVYRCGMDFLLQDSLRISRSPVLDLPSDTTLCAGSNFMLEGPRHMTSYRWSTGDSAYAILVTAPGAYSLEVKNNGCTASDDISIAFHPQLWVELGEEYFICNEEEELVLLDAGEGFMQYRWVPTGDTTQWIIVGDLGDYFVVVQDFHGCDGRDGTKVKRRCPVRVYFPNAFTPNEDGLNDEFVPQGADIISFHLQIYNRWGQQVFETDDITNTWSGKVKGVYAPSDVYTYQASWSGYFNKQIRRFEANGNISLIR